MLFTSFKASLSLCLLNIHQEYNFCLTYISLFEHIPKIFDMKIIVESQLKRHFTNKSFDLYKSACSDIDTLSICLS